VHLSRGRRLALTKKKKKKKKDGPEAMPERIAIAIRRMMR